MGFCGGPPQRRRASQERNTHRLLISAYFDIALRDFGLSLGALALAQLGSTYRNR